jgi:hypothetical protein
MPPLLFRRMFSIAVRRLQICGKPCKLSRLFCLSGRWSTQDVCKVVCSSGFNRSQTYISASRRDYERFCPRFRVGARTLIGGQSLPYEPIHTFYFEEYFKT